ncbi:cobalt-precorrin-6A reductase [Azospirillum sp. RWY-5-1]|uniref:Cobalt-precorrin-6A reductase n=1 Tax=Azospirillum oleiclasticum TaxID=2735135 RepID=A0ABX2T6I2_9PROT|nr:cobalt-precorrin-6A reductase [Azospirillum oleiclasticum]NYZ11731.1 cobalt-precorrin-6A reductase [Azospirillum oleiclasticum]NYZ18892.1 cobalt-precorrin-6A reductase [Azospirillum oleiclasticum]
MKALILGGTTEAMALAKRLADHPVIAAEVSLAGRTARPVLPPLPTRVGGFGGADGLAAYLTENRIGAVVDATHPFAARISANAVAACARAGVPLLVLTRAAWTAGPGDRWIGVPDMAAAAEALRPLGRRVFLTVGRQELAPFAAVPDWSYLIRAVDPPDPPPELPDHRVILDRGPYTLEGELALLAEHRIDALVSKNSGGTATAAKLEAARRLGIPVVMVERPADTGAPTVHAVGAALAWLEALASGREPE